MKYIYFGLIMFCIAFIFEHINEKHICKEKEYQEAFCKCNSERAKVREILKGDSLKTLLYW